MNDMVRTMHKVLLSRSVEEWSNHFLPVLILTSNDSRLGGTVGVVLRGGKALCVYKSDNIDTPIMHATWGQI